MPNKVVGLYGRLRLISSQLVKFWGQDASFKRVAWNLIRPFPSDFKKIRKKFETTLIGKVYSSSHNYLLIAENHLQSH